MPNFHKLSWLQSGIVIRGNSHFWHVLCLDSSKRGAATYFVENGKNVHWHIREYTLRVIENLDGLVSRIPERSYYSEVFRFLNVFWPYNEVEFR